MAAEDEPELPEGEPLSDAEPRPDEEPLPDVVPVSVPDWATMLVDVAELVEVW